MECFIDRLETVLKEQKITKTQLAADISMRRENLSDWKKNGGVPSSDVGIKIANYLNISLEWLVTGEGAKYVCPAEVPEEIFYLRKFELDLFKKYEDLSPDKKEVIKTLIKTLWEQDHQQNSVEDQFKKA